VAEAARDCDCVVLRHHGCSTLGTDVAIAFRRAINLEEAAMANYRALSIGDRSARFPPAALHHA
jgi:L-fuculose-phosphate aldolase